MWNSPEGDEQSAAPERTGGSQLFFNALFGEANTLPSHLHSQGKQLQLWSQLPLSPSLQLCTALLLPSLP